MLKVKGYVKQWFPLVVFLLITTACSEEGEHLPGDESGARIPLKVSALLATSDSNATEEEMSVYSAFVFIYNTNGHLENAGKTEVPVNRILPVDKDGNINISYEWLVRAGEKDIYVVLNPPVEVTESLKQTLTISQLRTLIARDFSIYDNDRGQVIGGGLMTGHLNVEVIASTLQSLPIRVTRRYARLELYFKKSQELASVETKVSRVTLKNYSSEVMLFESYPEWGGSQEGKEQRGYPEQIINNTENYVRLNRNFYMMPRPIQASLTKGVPTVKIDIPLGNSMFTYQIPLAKLDDTKKPDLKQPLSIEGNHLYRLYVTLTPKKEDVSVDLSVLPWEEDTPQQENIHGELSEHINCYVVDPGGTARIPTNSVYRIWNWLLHDPIPADGKVKAELIWSDTP